MAASVRLVLRTQKARADGTCPVYMRVTVNRRSRFLASGVFVEPRHWNDAKGQVRKGHPLAPAFNAKLQDLLMAAQEAALAGGSAEAVLQRVTEGSGSLSAFFNAYLASLDAKGRFWDWKKFRVTLAKIEQVFGPDVAFSDLDRHALVRFERHLATKLGNGRNTVLKEMQRLRRVVRQAVRDGAIKPGDDPFLTYERPKAERTDRRKLTLDEIRRLEALDLEGHSALALVRDAFVFAFYSGGMRFSDVVALRREALQAGRLEYRMLKTGTLVSLPLPPAALAIAARYAGAGAHAVRPFVFPFLVAGEDADPVHLRRRIASHNAKTNERLKVLAERAELERPDTVSFHVARHSFADYARVRSGDLYAISKALGHASLTITQTYLKSFDRDATDRLSAQLWSL